MHMAEFVELIAVANDTNGGHFSIGSEGAKFTITPEETRFVVRSDELTDKWLGEANERVHIPARARAHARFTAAHRGAHRPTDARSSEC